MSSGADTADIRILLVDDHQLVRDGLHSRLGETPGICVVGEAGTGAEALALATKLQPDLVLLDWMLPGLSGIELCRRIRARQETQNLPIILLTARGEESERVRGLATGADDYVVKPFSVPELLARVRALLRRSSPNRIADTLEAGELQLDRGTHRVKRGNREIHLGPTEFRLLEFLMERPGRVFTRAQMLDHVWSMDAEIDERTVDVHVGRLRKAINKPRERDPIRTVRGAGYSFDENFARSKPVT